MRSLDQSTALMRFKSGLHFENHTLGAFGHVVQLRRGCRSAIHFVEIGTLLAIAYVIFRPLAAPNAWPSASVRRLAAQLVRQHGQDTLSFFKLRPDKQYFFNDDRTAFVGYRVEAGTLLLSGDPVGPPEAFGDLLLEVRRFARSRGLKLAALGASEDLVPIHEGLGLHSLYLGDEAVVELNAFSLEGRAIRKVRQSVQRLRKAGYSSELLHARRDRRRDDAPDGARARASGASASPSAASRWDWTNPVPARAGHAVRARARRRGRRARRAALRPVLRAPGDVAVDHAPRPEHPERADGVPGRGRDRVDARARDRGDVAQLRGAHEYMRDPQNAFERLLGRAARGAEPVLPDREPVPVQRQVLPRWDPRYLVYEGRLGIARAGVAAMWAEGQMPKPTLPRACRTHTKVSGP